MRGIFGDVPVSSIHKQHRGKFTGSHPLSDSDSRCMSAEDEMTDDDDGDGGIGGDERG